VGIELLYRFPCFEPDVQVNSPKEYSPPFDSVHLFGLAVHEKAAPDWKSKGGFKSTMTHERYSNNDGN
jgi:hypothetical protein